MRDFKAGEIHRYPYVWLRQAALGRTEGEKNRPCCLLMSLPAGDDAVLYFMPISSSPPRSVEEAIEVPSIELRRAGLSEFKQAWLYLEFNKDSLRRSWYFDASQPPIGSFSPIFFASVARSILEAARAGKGRIVDRHGEA
jgi:hypothetical protein